MLASECPSSRSTASVADPARTPGSARGPRTGEAHEGREARVLLEDRMLDVDQVASGPREGVAQQHGLDLSVVTATHPTSARSRSRSQLVLATVAKTAASTSASSASLRHRSASAANRLSPARSTWDARAVTSGSHSCSYGRGEEDPTVGGVVHAVSRTESAQFVIPCRGTGRSRRVDDLRTHGVRDCRQHRRHHGLASGATFAGDETEEEAGRDPEGSEAVGLGVRLCACATEPDRAVVDLLEVEAGMFGDGVAEVGERDASRGADARGERRAVPVRRTGAVSGGVEVDEVGIQRAERRVVDAESLRRAARGNPAARGRSGVPARGRWRRPSGAGDVDARRSPCPASP